MAFSPIEASAADRGNIFFQSFIVRTIYRIQECTGKTAGSAGQPEGIFKR